MGSSHDFLTIFQRAIKARQLYGQAHPRSTEAVKALEACYGQLLQDKPQVQVAAKNGRLFVDKIMEDLQNLPIRNLANTLEEREIHAMLLYPGATVPELEALLGMLCQKPSQIRAQGGIRKMLDDQGVTHLRVLQVRLEDVSEAGEVASAFLESMAGLAGMAAGGGTQAGGSPGAGTGGQGFPGLGSGSGGQGGTGSGGGEAGGAGVQGSPSAGGFPFGSLAGGIPSGGPARTGDLPALVGKMREYLVASILGGQFPPDLSGLGPFMQSSGMDQQGIQPSTQGVMRQAVSSLEPEHQVDLFLGAAHLPPSPIRNLLGRLSASMSVQSLAKAFGRGSHAPEQIVELADQIKPLHTNAKQWSEQLVEALREEGMSEKQLGDLVDILSWDSQPVESKLDRLMQGQRIFEMPQEKVLAFLRELLEAGRNQEFLRLVRHYAAGLFSPAVVRRTSVATGFERIADWVDIPGMPRGLMDELMETLSRAYGREKDPDVHQWLSKAVEHVLWFWVELGDPSTAHRLFTELQDVVTEMSLPAPWKSQATLDLLARLGAPERVDKVLDQLFLLDRQDAAVKIHPYLRMLGSSSANILVEKLSEEPDRSRRARLLEALKSCGQVAEAPLLESLKSPEWYVVRNALIVLSEISDPERVPDLQPLLLHQDARVVGAAIRALGRLGGRAAENAIIPLLSHRAPSLQMEALFTLNEMKARQAVPALVELTRGGRGKLRPEQERVREKALEMLGTLGSNSVIPALQELLVRRRGFFKDSKEPLEIRLQAMKALLRLETPEAQEALDRILREEPKGPDREAFQSLLAEAGKVEAARQA